MAAAACATVCCAPVASTVAKATSSKPRFTGLAKIALTPTTNEFAAKTVSNGVSTRAMLVWEPTDNKYFETLSFLPPLTDEQILKQVEYCISSGWVPCLEFASAEMAAIGNVNTSRMLGSAVCGYYDNRYWTMYKLPMFGCSDPGQVLSEIQNCMKTFPGSYVRLVAFDNVRQVQCTSFVVHRPAGSGFAAVEDRSK